MYYLYGTPTHAAASPQETRRTRPQKMAAQGITRSQLGLCRRRRPGPARPSRAGALVPPGPQLDGAVRNGHPEGRPDGALDQPDLAAMSAHQLGRDRQAKAGAAGAVRALERLEQMRARLRGKAGTGV